MQRLEELVEPTQGHLGLLQLCQGRGPTQELGEGVDIAAEQVESRVESREERDFESTRVCESRAEDTATLSLRARD